MKVKNDITDEDLKSLIGSKIVGIHLDDSDSDYVNCFILQTDKGSFRIDLLGENSSTSQRCELAYIEPVSKGA